MIAEIPISVIITLLEHPQPRDAPYLLKSLSQSFSTIAKATKPEINHLTARILNLLNSQDDHQKWYGCHLIQVIGSNPIILTNQGQGFIVALLKTINDTRTIPLNFKNATLALDTVIKGIRGKPVLTREILTPNLPSIISSLIDKLEKDVVNVIPVLQSLILKNTTTFKPFLNKFETKLIAIMCKDNFSHFDTTLQKHICSCFAYLKLANQSQNQQQQKNGHSIQALPDDQWRIKIFQVLAELSSVVEIYDSLIDLKEEADLVKMLELLSSKYSDRNSFIFPFLKVDLSEPFTITAISKRIHVLVQILIGFISSPTPFPLRIPLGTIIQAGNLLASLSLNYIPFKKELARDEGITKIISTDITTSQAIGAGLINEIVLTYKRLALPHFKAIISSLEVMIPVEKNKQKTNSKVVKIDEAFALSIETQLLQLIKTTTNLFHMADGLTEYDLVNKLIDIGVLLLKKRAPLDGVLDKQENKHQESSQQRNKNKKKKNNKDATPMADILSHAELFELEPNHAVINTVVKFFEIVMKKLSKLSTNSRLKIVKYAISQAVKQKTVTGAVQGELVRLLEIVVLYPGDGEVFSYLPIVKTLLPNNDKLSLLTNPRFPPLDVKFNLKRPEMTEELEEEEEDEEPQTVVVDKEQVEVQDFLLESKSNGTYTATTTTTTTTATTATQSVFKTDEEIKTLQFAKKEDSKTRPLEEDEEEKTPSKRVKVAEEEPVSKSIPIVVSTTTITATAKEDIDSSDSEFEIPNIELDSDDDE